MKHSELLNLVLRSLYELKGHGADLVELLKSKGIDVTLAEVDRIGQRLHEDGYVEYSPTKVSYDIELTSEGIEFVEEHLVAQPEETKTTTIPEFYDGILDALMKRRNFSSSELKYYEPSFKDVDSARLDLAFEEMKNVAGKFIDLKRTTGDKPVLIRNNYTKVLKEDGGFKRLMGEAEPVAPVRVKYLRANGRNPLADMHPRVQEIATNYFNDGHFRSAILDTYIALVSDVKQKSGLDLDGVKLMQNAFSKDHPHLIVSDDADEQAGFMWLFNGAVMAIRNPKAHRIIEQTDPQRTLEWLSFASVLFRVLDESNPPTF